MEQLTKQQKQKRFLLVLPVIVLPFVTFLLWSAGLLGPAKAKAQDTASLHGFNMHLPDAKFTPHKSWNKLNFYEQADKDSAKYRDALKNDPFFGLQAQDTGRHGIAKPGGFAKLDYDPSPSSGGNYRDANEEKVYQKLAQLNKALQATPQPKQLQETLPAAPAGNTSMNSPDIDRLENMLQTINQKGNSTDPEMKQLDGMMDKILAIQHPETVKATTEAAVQQHKPEAFAIKVDTGGDNISAMQAKDTVLHIQQQNAFYSLDEGAAAVEQQNAVQAVVQETQTLVSGSTVKLRLLNDVYINGVLVPKDGFVYGVASLNGERLNIAISSIRCQNTILPVSLSVYDMDGLSGIFIPGAITRDVAKESAAESVQGMGLTTLDPSLGAQAASAGIEAAKTLIGKKVRLVKVTVKAGYAVLLKDNKSK